MKTHQILLAVCSLSLAFSLKAQADEKLVYTLKTTDITHQPQASQDKDKSSKQDKPASTEKASEVTITLGDNYVIQDDSETTHIIDFAKKRIVSVDKKANEYHDVALHSTVYFRAMELKNRLMLGQILKNTGATLDAFRPFDSETLLGLTIPGLDSTKVEEKTSNGAIDYVHDGQLVAWFEPSTEKISESAKTGYRRFLANMCQLHPQIRESLLKQETFPKTLKYQAKMAGLREEAKEFKLKSASTVSAVNADPPAGCKLVRDEALTPIYEGLDKLGEHPKFPERAEITKKVDDLIKSGKALDALLVILEYHLSTDENMDPETKKAMEAGKDNPAFQKFLRSSQSTAPSGAESAIKELESLDRSNPSAANVLDILCANLYFGLTQRTPAIQLMTKALTRNPLITGAYHDLGNMYLSIFQSGTGWDCFRLAQKLSPSHKMVNDISQLDAQLEKDYPEFF
ncbi:MAG TPA: hypothetical protein V6C97_16520 [Oculatellaceae cyanobacterium]